mgnify:FL=1|tara:strand:- start:664 stop:1113 length:450 start_codon:yes stop_codon:yes gene_type:complete
MAHFAKISEDNEVLTVLTLNNVDMQNADGVEEETVGQQYLERHNNWPANLWIQTSYNTSNGQHKEGGTPLRGNYAGIGMTYDQNNDIFIGSKTFASWVLNVAEARWQSPIGDAPALTSEQQSQNDALTHMWIYNWNESGQSWDIENFKV